MNFGTWKASTNTCHSTITARCTIRMIAKDRVDPPSPLNTVRSLGSRVRFPAALRQSYRGLSR
jgi:hypothetical protein